ncbi:hypothetical protein CAOG_01776 [Capsaspora owczarzaki ATCC 30864]|uniref:HMG box domain-containing protein n=1 Tax=Capsaspora owczarzaki (strain ATCC 30864) TaxID=595528 RepID=A0A0D2U5P5_CAPO3|nr:hypothetical protein CAOG_01776 [Capsaspora owczarzaki ATCC 30864]KJE90466.1 hypothetical protein CAOG_001776 [Capsaspora owczarzaki ATCC 30864]|eukprot:XP_004364644.1 hypothetical protein CAOG_01776 [Capsaspora owczarzaki ATCC 30864]
MNHQAFGHMGSISGPAVPGSEHLAMSANGPVLARIAANFSMSPTTEEQLRQMSLACKLATTQPNQPSQKPLVVLRRIAAKPQSPTPVSEPTQETTTTKRRGPNGFIVFRTMNKHRYSHLPSRASSIELGKLWKQLSSDERVTFEMEAQKRELLQLNTNKPARATKVRKPRLLYNNRLTAAGRRQAQQVAESCLPRSFLAHETLHADHEMFPLDVTDASSLFPGSKACDPPILSISSSNSSTFSSTTSAALSLASDSSSTLAEPSPISDSDSSCSVDDWRNTNLEAPLHPRPFVRLLGLSGQDDDCENISSWLLPPAETAPLPVLPAPHPKNLACQLAQRATFVSACHSPTLVCQSPVPLPPPSIAIDMSWLDWAERDLAVRSVDSNQSSPTQ